MAILLAFRAAAAEPQVEVVRIAPAPDAAGPRESIPALLTRPARWRPGRAAAVLVADAPGPEPWRRCLADLLVAGGVATLELDVLSPRGFAADSAAALPEPTPAALLPDLFGALWALEDVGAGPVAVVGRGPGGGAALLMADEATARAQLAPGASRFAALAPPARGLALAAVAEVSAAGAELEAIHGAVDAAAEMASSAPGRAAYAGLAGTECVPPPRSASRGSAAEPRPALAAWRRR